MNTQKALKTNEVTSIKDKTKGQKIVAAIYLLTNHLSDSDPLKNKLRLSALSLLTHPTEKETNSNALVLVDLLEASSLAGLISENNTSLVREQLELFLSQKTTASSPSLSSLFENLEKDNMSVKDNRTASKSLSDKSSRSNISRSETAILKNNPDSSLSQSELKAKRQDQILSFINSRKSAGIKDIAELFPSVSEKTIQREVSTLVEKGFVSKRGNKRWSIYVAISK